MTNVDFFRAFAASKSYYFEHSRDGRDFHQLYEAASSTDTTKAMFHLTSSFNEEHNESGATLGTRYRGEIMVLIKSDLDEVVDVQMGNSASDGKYTKRVKSLIESGGIQAEIITYNRCNDRDYELTFSDGQEVYNELAENMDGIVFRYTLYIKE